MADNEEARQAEEKCRKREQAIREINQRHLELGRYLQRVGLEEFKKEAERKQCTFTELIAEVRAQGEDVPPEIEKLILDAEGNA